MQVTVAMVSDVLETQAECARGGAYCPNKPVSMAFEWYTYDSELIECCLLVVPYDQRGMLPQEFVEHPECLVFTASSIPNPVPPCALFLGGTDSQHAVFLIESAVWRYKDVFSKMIACSFDDGGLTALVELAHELLGNPILLEDRAMRVKARTLSDVMEGDVWRPLDPVEPSFAGQVVMDGFEEMMEELKVQREVRLFELKDGIRFAVRRTREMGGECLYVYLFEKNHPISDGDMGVLRVLCSALDIVLRTTAGYSDKSIGYCGVLADALEGSVSSQGEFMNRMRTLGFELKSRSRLIVAAPSKGRLSERQAQRLINDIQNTFPFGAGIFYKDYLVFFSTSEEGCSIREADCERFELFLERFRMVAAMSDDVPTELPLKDLFQDTLFTLDVGRRERPQQSLQRFSECRSFWPYDVCVKSGRSRLFYHPAISVLLDHDRECSDSLCFVLEKLTLNWGNKSITARELFIQRNTLLAKIKTIERLCHIDLSDRATVLHLRQSFLLRAYSAENKETGVKL